MASPHVTGLVGILRQIRPDLTVNEFYNIIIDTAYFSPTWGTRPNNNYGWGEIDDYAAAVYVRDAGAVSGKIMDGSCDTRCTGRGRAGIRQHAGQQGAGRGHPQDVLGQQRQLPHDPVGGHVHA